MRRRGFLRALLAAAALPALPKPKPEPEPHVFEWQDGPPVLLTGLEPNAAYECRMRIGGPSGWSWDPWVSAEDSGLGYEALTYAQRLRNRELAAQLELLP